ncbi:MAG: signal recognition particle protein [Ardenticatenales bacterium]|jgi:signal recognition particle subunit SRP54|nr:signal recognition particle protein [Ardenticatenales bacterium]
MFNALQDKLEALFGDLAKKGVLTEADVDRAMRELRLALLDADVQFGVVKDLVARVKERAVGAEVMRSLSPAQQVVTIVYDELVATLGKAAPLDIGRGDPPVIVMAGLQGAGKTTTAAKLALMLRKKGKRALLVACDTRRPAAIQQLESLGKQLDVAVYSEGAEPAPPDIAARSIQFARRGAYDVVIVDTSGRLQIDEPLMDELAEITRRVKPVETLLVVDAMTGQEAVNVAAAFHERLSLTGLILTKIDGDARGGAALSVRAVTGVPIKFLGVGEKTGALEAFEPERLASRILGRGDLASLLERAAETVDADEAERMGRKLQSGQLDLQDFLTQMQQLKKMGPLREIMGLIPGLGKAMKQLPADVDDGALKRVEAIILSMTPRERKKPDVLNGSRRRRIAAGSGTSVPEVNDLLRNFKSMQTMMKRLSGGKSSGGKMKLPPGLLGT